MKTINLSKLANHIQAYHNKNISQEWKDIHQESIEKMGELLPHGSGIDGKCYIDIDNSTKDKIYLFVEFHHMDENGFYCGWSEHNIILTPSFSFGYDMRITGKDKNGIKDYLQQTFSEYLACNEHEMAILS